MTEQSENVTADPHIDDQNAVKGQCSALRGIFKGAYAGIDIDQFIRAERDSWDAEAAPTQLSDLEATREQFDTEVRLAVQRAIFQGDYAGIEIDLWDPDERLQKPDRSS